MSEPAPIRVGLIGYGVAGSVFHAPLIHASPDCELSVIVTGNASRRQAAAARFPRARVLDDTALLTPDDVDVVVVATPNATHADLTHDALDRGLPVVVDKPIATSAADAEAMIDHAAQAGLLLTCFQNRRWDGDFRTLRDLIGMGELGRVFQFESRFERWRPTIKPGWKEIQGPGSGVLFDLGPHLIDQALVLFGPPEVVGAEIRTVRNDAVVTDHAFLMLRHEGGVCSQLSMSHISGSPGPRFRILGDQGAYVKRFLDPQEEELRAGEVPGDADWGTEPSQRWGTIQQGADRNTIATQPGDYLQFYRLLAAALRGHGPVPVDPGDSLAGLRVIEAATSIAC